jgi:predicted Fe-Mo cluster-binding NifX family protein
MSGERLIAIAAEDERGLCGRISSHFGRCPFYVLVDANERVVLGVRVVANPYFDLHRPGIVPRFVRDLGATAILSGGMGPRAINMFRRFGVDVAIVPSRTVATALMTYLRGDHSEALPCARAHSDLCREGE